MNNNVTEIQGIPGVTSGILAGKIDLSKSKPQRPMRTHLTAARLAENLFGKYLEKGAMLEKRGLPSDADPESPVTSSNRYVLADITSFFTLLVGIYFPSVTGEAEGEPGSFGRCCLGIFVLS